MKPKKPRRIGNSVTKNEKIYNSRLHFSMHWKDTIINPNSKKYEDLNDKIMFRAELRIYIFKKNFTIFF